METGTNGGHGSAPGVRIIAENDPLLAQIARAQRLGDAFRRQAAKVTACLGEDRCQSGKIPLLREGEKLLYWPCPVMGQVRTAAEARGKCPYVEKLFRNLDAAQTGALRDVRVPKRLVEAMAGTVRESKALREAQAWNGRGVLALCGGVGVGKSFAAAWALRRLLREMFSPEDFRRPMSWGGTLDDARRSMGWCHVRDLTQAQEQDRRRLATLPVLVVDDLGSENTTPVVRELFNWMATTRHDERRVTIYTANLSVEALMERYGERFLDRLLHEGRVSLCDGPNMRWEGAAVA